jgi:hypothetical protein
MRAADIQEAGYRDTRRDKRQTPDNDLVNRRFHATDPNQLWWLT